MFSKSFALFSLLVVTGNVTADLHTKTKTNNEEISNVIYSIEEVDAFVKNIPMNVIRKLNSETCESDTIALGSNQDLKDASVEYHGSPANPFCSGSDDLNYSCDFKNAAPNLEAVCGNVGGQFFQFSVTVKGSGVSIALKNMASCIGASCDKKAALKIFEEVFAGLAVLGEVTVKESAASTVSPAASTVSSAGVIMALTGVLATLI